MNGKGLEAGQSTSRIEAVGSPTPSMYSPAREAMTKWQYVLVTPSMHLLELGFW
jgi:hypothetical protein